MVHEGSFIDTQTPSSASSPIQESFTAFSHPRPTKLSADAVFQESIHPTA
jgi:hypothetical protein